jgi:hypothetical protein
MNIPRSIKFFWQRITRGWDDSDTWDLRLANAKFFVPRLKRFKELNICIPEGLTSEEWDGILDEIIWMFELNINDSLLIDDEKEQQRYDTAFDLYCKYYHDLWW